MKIKVIDALESICDQVDNTSVNDKYSGRGMFGRTCLGISADTYINIIELAAQKGVTGAKIDNLGMGYIVYWPRFTEESEIDEVELITTEELDELQNQE